MSKKASTNKLVLYNSLSTIILYAITFFSAPIFSRQLGTENYGIVQVYNSWTAFFVIIVGLFTRGTLSMARIKFPEEEVPKYESSVMFMSLISFFMFLGILMAFGEFLVPILGLPKVYLIILLFQSFGTYAVYFLNDKFTFEMKAQNNLLISVTIALANFGLSFLLISLLPEELSYTGRILGMTIPYVVAGSGALIYVFRQGKTGYCTTYWKFCFPLSFPLIFHGIAGVICAFGDRIMIQKMISVSIVGIYSLAYNFSNVMSSIQTALNNSWTPFFLDHIKTEQYSQLKKRSASYIRLYSCLTVGFILLTPEVFQLFASREYWEGAVIIPIVVLSHYANYLYTFAANYEFCFMRTDFVAVGSVISGVANVILNFFLINLWGYMGAAVATLLSGIVLLTVHTIFAKKLVKDKWVYSLNMFVPAIIGIICAVTLYYMCYDMWLVRWVAALFVGMYMLGMIYKEKAIF